MNVPRRRTIGIEEPLAKRRKKNEGEGKYVNCEFILGSVVEVGRRFYIATRIFTAGLFQYVLRIASLLYNAMQLYWTKPLL